jgi:hypothetical protein
MLGFEAMSPKPSVQMHSKDPKVLNSKRALTKELGAECQLTQEPCASTRSELPWISRHREPCLSTRISGACVQSRDLGDAGQEGYPVFPELLKVVLGKPLLPLMVTSHMTSIISQLPESG